MSTQPTPEELFEAIKARDAGRVKTLLDQGADPNAKVDVSGRLMPMLHQALTYDEWDNSGTCELTRLLVEKGANIEMTDDYFDRTPLMHAAYGQGYTLKYLIEKGAVLDKKDREGRTALNHTLISRGTENTVTKNILEAALRLAEEKAKEKTVQEAEQKKFAALHNTAKKRQDALNKLRPKMTVRPS